MAKYVSSSSKVGRNEDEMAEYVSSSSKMGRIEDEVVAVDKKNRLP